MSRLPILSAVLFVATLSGCAEDPKPKPKLPAPPKDIPLIGSRLGGDGQAVSEELKVIKPDLVDVILRVEGIQKQKRADELEDLLADQRERLRLPGTRIQADDQKLFLHADANNFQLEPILNVLRTAGFQVEVLEDPTTSRAPGNGVDNGSAAAPGDSEK